jgi:hypothetical protein
MTDQPVQPEATTKAGQALEAWLREPENYEWGRKVTNAILAIEAEAYRQGWDANTATSFGNRAASQERPQPDPSSALFTIPRWQYTDEDEGITADVVWLNDAVQAVEGVAQERPQPDLRAALERVTEATWITDGDNKPICMLCDCRRGSEPDWCDAVKARAALSGVAQERPSIDVECADCERIGAPCRQHLLNEPVDGALLEQSIRATSRPGLVSDGWTIADHYNRARLAGGSVASPEPNE